MEPHSVAILLCTCNGQDYLPEQLASFSAQSWTHWKLWVSDDRSQDRTLELLHTWRAALQNPERATIFHCEKEGGKKGASANFLSLVCDTDISADFYAYSDQDDIWEPDKLERALRFLEPVPVQTPALYCSRTCLIDEKGHKAGFSPLYKKPPGFANALAQNIGGGNTMVFNQAARELLQKAGCSIQVPVHDWWTYLVISACGGQVFYDPRPSLYYRQHSSNLIGNASSWKARWRRVQSLFQGGLKNWNHQHITALQTLEEWISPQNRILLAEFSKIRKKNGLAGWRALRRSGIYTQTLPGTLKLMIGALAGKL